MAADDATTPPDPQLADILATLTEILLVLDAGSGGGRTSSDIDPQLEDILEELKKLYDVQTAVTATAIPTAQPVQEASVIETLTSALGTITAAIGAVVAALLAAVAITHSFVQALDPGLVEQFGRVLKDLQATVGVAFTAIFEQGMNFIRELSAQLQPVFAALKPVVDQIVNTVLRALSAALTALTPVLLATVPLIKILADVVSLIIAVLRPLIAVYMVFYQVLMSTLGVVFTLLAAAIDPFVKIVDAFSDGIQDIVQLMSTMLRVLVDSLNAFIMSLFGTGLDGIVKQVSNAFRELLVAIAVTAAKLALMVGATDFVQRLRNALTNTGESATGSTAIKTLEQIGKDMATASVNAAGTASAKDATNADIVKVLDAMLQDNKRNTDGIIAAIGKSTPGGAAAGVVPKVALGKLGFEAAGVLGATLESLKP